MFVIGGRWFQGQENAIRVLGITGACLCLTREDFKIGGMSSGYLGKWGVFVIGARRFLVTPGTNERNINWTEGEEH